MITGIPTTIGNFVLAGIWLTFPEPLYISFVSSTTMGFLWLLVVYGSWKNN
jgi:hypothetical protein